MNRQSKKHSSRHTIEESELGREPYHRFCELYDAFTDHIPYAAWAGYLRGRARTQLGCVPDALLDLGCGTARLGAELAGDGRRIVGIDRSSGMLERARQRLPQGSFRLARLEQRLPFQAGAFAWILCTHDSINYVSSLAGLRAHFREVARVLASPGLYSFDAVNLTADLSERDFDAELPLGRGRVLRRSARFDAHLRMMCSRIALEEGGVTAWSEEHRQRLHSAQEITSAAQAAGLSLAEVGSDYESYPPDDDSHSVNFHFLSPG